MKSWCQERKSILHKENLSWYWLKFSLNSKFRVKKQIWRLNSKYGVNWGILLLSDCNISQNLVHKAHEILPQDCSCQKHEYLNSACYYNHSTGSCCSAVGEKAKTKVSCTLLLHSSPCILGLALGTARDLDLGQEMQLQFYWTIFTGGDELLNFHLMLTLKDSLAEKVEALGAFIARWIQASLWNL